MIVNIFFYIVNNSLIQITFKRILNIHIFRHCLQSLVKVLSVSIILNTHEVHQFDLLLVKPNVFQGFFQNFIVLKWMFDAFFLLANLFDQISDNHYPFSFIFWKLSHLKTKVISESLLLYLFDFFRVEHFSFPDLLCVPQYKHRPPKRLLILFKYHDTILILIFVMLFVEYGLKVRILILVDKFFVNLKDPFANSQFKRLPTIVLSWHIYYTLFNN